MKANQLQKMVHAITVVAVIFSVTLSDMLIVLPEGAHGQEPLGGKLAYIGANQNIWLANADGSEKQQLTFSGGVHAFAWSPDGERIAYIKDQQPASRYLHPNRLADLMILDLSNLSERIVVQDIMFFRAGHSLDWAPDGHRIAFQAVEGLERVPLYWVTYLVDIESSALEAVGEYEEWPTGWPWPFVSSAVSFSPDGHYLLDYRAGIIPLGPAAGREELPCGRVWSSDGKSVVCWNPLRVLSLDGDILAEYEVWAGSVASSPQGDKLAVGGTVGEDAGLWIVDIATGELHRLVSTSHAEEAWEPTWSPDGTQLAFTYITEFLGEYEGGGEIEGIGVVNVDGTGLKVISGAYWPAWQPISRVDPSDLIEQKRSSIEFLSGVGYNEQPSQGLLDRLEARAAEGEHLSPSDLSALQRLVLTEELLTGFYPHYARTSADTGEALTSFVLILFGFVKALRMVEARLPDSPFTRPAKALIAKIIEKLIDLINHGLQFLECRVIPSELRPTFHNLRQLLWAYAKAHIMAPEDPFGPGGEALVKLLSDPDLGISRDNILLSGYRRRTQPLIDKAVLTADPDHTGSDPLNVHPTDEGAKLQMEGVVNQLEIWSDYHHTTYQDLKEAADIPALAADAADIASLTGVFAPIAQVVARAADLMELLITGYAGGKSWQFLECIEQSAQDGQARIYDPSMRLETPPACERSRKLGLFAPSRRHGAYHWPAIQPLAGPQQESEEYQQLLQQVIAALESEDRQTLAELVPQLLDADEELSQALDLATTPILATADYETSEQLFSQGVSLDLDTIVLYAYLADALLLPEEASFNAARDQAHTVASTLDRYQQLVGMTQLAPTEPKPIAILLTSSVSLPEETTLDREFTVEVGVANVGAVPAREATLVVSTEEGMEPRETATPLGDLEAESTRTVTVHLTSRQEGASLITLTVSSQDGSSASRLVLIEVERGEGLSGVTVTPSTLWPWVIRLGLLALTLVSLLAVGWRVRWRRKTPSEAIVKLCPNCGARNVAAAKFCIKCGKVLTG